MKIQLVREGAKAPKRATNGSAGYDLYIPEDVYVKTGRNLIPLGFIMEIPFGVVGRIESRSGFASKGIEGADGIYHDADVEDGKIDSDFRGEPRVIVINHEGYPFFIAKGTRIAQMIFYKYESYDFIEADSLSETERGDGGLGHSGVR